MRHVVLSNDLVKHIQSQTFKEGLEASPSFWKVACQTKCQKLAKPTILCGMTDWKIQEKKEKRQEFIALLAGYK